MKLAELKTLEKKELEKRLEKVSKDLYDLKFDVKIGQEKNYKSIGAKKTEIARIKTLLSVKS